MSPTGPFSATRGPLPMYLPPRKKEKPKNPFKFERSRHFVIGATGFFLVSIAMAALLALRRVQERKRETTRTLHARHSGNPRVVILGGGPAGAALAASVTRTLPQTLVTVVEKERLQVFMGQVPHAHAGHRSYDMNTSGGWDFLRSPTTWNVTREAELVCGTVVAIHPHQQEVLVDEGRTPPLSTQPKRTPQEANSAHRHSPRPKKAERETSVDPLPTEASSASRALLQWASWLSPASSAVAGKDGTRRTEAGERPHAGEAAALYDTLGRRRIRYDVLIVATGAERTLGSLDQAQASLLHKCANTPSTRWRWWQRGTPQTGGATATTTSRSGEVHLFQKRGAPRLLTPADVDCGSIALQPGTTRDLMAHLYKGEVLHLKVPPLSFAGVMTRAQALRAEEERRTGSENALPLGDEAEGQRVLSTARAGVVTEVVPSLWAFESLQLPSRQDDATFISTTNLLWKFMCYFNKLHGCALLSISPDPLPLPYAFTVEQAQPSSSDTTSAVKPHTLVSLSAWNREILSFWDGRQAWGTTQASLPDVLPMDWMLWGRRWWASVFRPDAQRHVVEDPRERCRKNESPSSLPCVNGCGAASPVGSTTPPALVNKGEGTRVYGFYPHHHTYVQSIDPVRREVWLRDYQRQRSWCQPYRVLILDLPLRAAGDFIQSSGLHRKDYVEDVVRPFMQHFANGTAAATPAASLANALKSLSRKELHQLFDAESSFMDVDPHTLQHRRYPNIFAMGDCAGLPVVKSYGAVFSQVPVVRFNIQQYLSWKARRSRLTLEAQPQQPAHHFRFFPTLRRGSSAPPSGSGAEEPRLARYKGYSSFHVVMTPWRCMWATVMYSTAFRGAGHPSKVPALAETHSPRHRVSAERDLLPWWSSRRQPHEAHAAVVAMTLPMQSSFDDSSSPSSGPERTRRWAEEEELAPLHVGGSDATRPAAVTAPPLESREGERWKRWKGSAPGWRRDPSSASWRGLQGTWNGIFLQSALYEVLYFFVFMRGLWYPPDWFRTPMFDWEDEEETPSGKEKSRV